MSQTSENILKLGILAAAISPNYGEHTESRHQSEATWHVNRKTSQDPPPQKRTLVDTTVENFIESGNPRAMKKIYSS